MAELYVSLEPKSNYYDKKAVKSYEEWEKLIRKSTTVYVGNLSFYTSEDIIYDLFARCGDVKSITMGLNALKKQPCGFCFVNYYDHDSASRAVSILHEAICDERVIRVDWDAGLNIDGSRKYGRGINGLQWRDEFRKDYDPGRGGYGSQLSVADVADIKRKRAYETMISGNLYGSGMPNSMNASNPNFGRPGHSYGSNYNSTMNTGLIHNYNHNYGTNFRPQGLVQSSGSYYKNKRNRRNSNHH